MKRRILELAIGVVLLLDRWAYPGGPRRIQVFTDEGTRPVSGDGSPQLPVTLAAATPPGSLASPAPAAGAETGRLRRGLAWVLTGRPARPRPRRGRHESGRILWTPWARPIGVA